MLSAGQETFDLAVNAVGNGSGSSLRLFIHSSGYWVRIWYWNIVAWLVSFHCMFPTWIQKQMKWSRLIIDWLWGEFLQAWRRRSSSSTAFSPCHAPRYSQCSWLANTAGAHQETKAIYHPAPWSFLFIINQSCFFQHFALVRNGTVWNEEFKGLRRKFKAELTNGKSFFYCFML